jgi:hypothetical protein
VPPKEHLGFVREIGEEGFRGCERYKKVEKFFRFYKRAIF